MAQYWYALRSKPRKEDVVWKQVRDKGIDVFYPRIRIHPVNPRSRKIIPYFPGYMFVRIDLGELGLSAFQWMPYSSGLVTFGDEPAIVPENLVYELRQKVAHIAESGGEIFTDIRQGDTVMITHGPFEGYEAIFDTRLPGTERVRVLLQLLSNNKRVVPVELEVSAIQRKKRSDQGRKR